MLYDLYIGILSTINFRVYDIQSAVDGNRPDKIQIL